MQHLKLEINRVDLDDQIIAQALAIIAKRLTEPACYVKGPDTVVNYLRLHLGQEKREVFTVIFLDHHYGVIQAKDMFFGTLDNIVVWPREIAKIALEVNASSVILAHNHPAGNPKPSQKDILLTAKVHESLQLLGMAVVDHIIVGRDSSHSLRKSGEFNPNGTKQTAGIILLS